MTSFGADKKVFPNFYILGWYSTGSDAQESDMDIHRALMDINGSPVYILLNPSIIMHRRTSQSLEMKVVNFVQASYAIETVEAEQISVDHVAHLKPSDGGSGATQCSICAMAAHLTGTHSAIKMLSSRIIVLHHYLLAMQKGEIPHENSLLRQVSSLLRRLPKQGGNVSLFAGFFTELTNKEYNDTLLVSYLAMFTNCSSTMNELVDRFNAAYERHGRIWLQLQHRQV